MEVTVRTLFETGKVHPIGKYFGVYGDIIYYLTEQHTLCYSTTKSIRLLELEYRQFLTELDPTLLPYLDEIHGINTPTVRVFDKYARKVERILLYTQHAEQPAIPLDIRHIPQPLTEKAIKKLIKQHVEKIRGGE